MKTKLVETTNGSRNWGKFLLARFDAAEWTARSEWAFLRREARKL
jgi:hypothetical protein